MRALLRRGPALASLGARRRRPDASTRAPARRARGGRAIQLTTKEYALLEYLARRPGEVVGRADIAEHVWDDSFDPMSNLIEVYIQRLRRKIDDGHAGEADPHPPRRRVHARRADAETLMIESVRGRLTLWYVGVLAAALVVVGVLIYVAAGARALCRIDENLQAVVQIADHLARQRSG